MKNGLYQTELNRIESKWSKFNEKIDREWALSCAKPKVRPIWNTNQRPIFQTQAKLWLKISRIGTSLLLFIKECRATTVAIATNEQKILWTK